MRKNILVFILILLLALGAPLSSFAQGDTLGIKDTGNYLLKNIPKPQYGMVGGDWTVLGLARSGMALPASYTNEYWKNVDQTLKEAEGELGRNKYSEYSRLILGLNSTGRDPSKVAGYNLLDRLTDLATIERQGINGPIYALLALDSLGRDSLIREDLIGSILTREIPGGGFALSGKLADPDVTAAVIQALSPYRNRLEVNQVIERALTFLAKNQRENGGYAGWSAGGQENLESTAQVILALTALGIDPKKDQSFIKKTKVGGQVKEVNLIDVLISFRLKDGSYSHFKGESSDLMATEQALLALVSYDRLLKKQNHIYRMGDIGGKDYRIKVVVNGEYLSFDVEPIMVNSRILIPMRATFQALGAQVDWNDKLRQVSGSLNNDKLVLTIDKTTALINGKATELDVPATIKNRRTLVPLRFVAESLGAEVAWDQKTKTATVDLKLWDKE